MKIVNRNTELKSGWIAFFDEFFKRLICIILLTMLLYISYNNIFIVKFNTECKPVEEVNIWLFISLIINCISGITVPNRIQNISWVILILMAASIFCYWYWFL